MRPAACVPAGTGQGGKATLYPWEGAGAWKRLMKRRSM